MSVYLLFAQMVGIVNIFNPLGVRLQGVVMRIPRNLSKIFWSVLFCFISTSAIAESKQQIGWVEKVAVNDPAIILHAKIDTGAENSSLHAADYVIFTKEGQVWVRFNITTEGGETLLLEKPVERFAKIKQKVGESENQRPIVKLKLCLGNKIMEAYVNLVNRERFSYPLLIGRSFLAGSFVVDAESTYLTAPMCDYK